MPVFPARSSRSKTRALRPVPRLMTSSSIEVSTYVTRSSMIRGASRNSGSAGSNKSSIREISSGSSPADGFSHSRQTTRELLWKIMLPSTSSMRSISQGSTRNPPFAIAVYPRAISSGVKAWVPRASVRLGCISSTSNPVRSAISISFLTPSCCRTRMDTKFRENVSASLTLVGP